VAGLVRLVRDRDQETASHLTRLGRYSRLLAQAAAEHPCFRDRLDAGSLALLPWAAALHDVGKVGVPSTVLLKPGPLTAEERRAVEAHTTLGASLLHEAARRHGSALAFWAVAVGVARHHHERWDGRGYPDGLSGEAIPLAARLVALADVYDALRSRRPYKAPLGHADAVVVMTRRSPGQFDPTLLEVFARTAGGLARVFQEHGEAVEPPTSPLPSV
jgi:putative two-component system response regulator